MEGKHREIERKTVWRRKGIQDDPLNHDIRFKIVIPKVRKKDEN